MTGTTGELGVASEGLSKNLLKCSEVIEHQTDNLFPNNPEGKKIFFVLYLQLFCKFMDISKIKIIF